MDILLFIEILRRRIVFLKVSIIELHELLTKVQHELEDEESPLFNKERARCFGNAKDLAGIIVYEERKKLEEMLNKDIPKEITQP